MIMEKKWIHIISVKVGDCKLAYFRTKQPGQIDERKLGYGYFVLLYFTIFKNTPKMDLKLPLRLLPFLRRKLKEFETGNKSSESILIDGVSFSLVAWPDNDTVQMNCYEAGTDANHLATFKMADLKKLVMCLDGLALLVKTQPERTETAAEYMTYINDLICWAVARCAYKEVCKLLEPGKAIESVEQYVELWNQVQENSMSDFKCCVDKFIEKVKERIPVQAQPTHSAEAARNRDEFTSFGFLYSRPLQDWQPAQFVVDLLHSSDC